MKTSFLFTLLFAGLMGPAMPSLADATGQGVGHGMMWHDGWGWGNMIFGPLMMIAFAAVVVVLVVLAFRWLGGASHGAVGPSSTPLAKTPLDILEERFARGEIDKDEFDERRHVLAD